MTTDLIPHSGANQALSLDPSFTLPGPIARSSEKSIYRFIEFFTAEIQNPHTRKMYFRNAHQFFAWADRCGLELETIRSVHVAAYIEDLLGQGYSRPTVKQHLATLRRLFDYLVTGQIVPSNPAAAVRGPKHVVNEGVTPILTEEDARKLFESIDTSTLLGLRDRALVAVMVYTFARVEAALLLKVGDYFAKGKRWWLKLQEKNGKIIQMPAHHKLEEYLDAYFGAVGIEHANAEHKKMPLFRSARGRSRKLSERRMSTSDAWRMIQRRALKAGLETKITCHSFRGTGITNYLINGGKLETAQKMAGHSDPRTTKIYDRRNDTLTLDEVEKISI